ncbi:MAG: hypothetical protein E7184_00050 [Erysipelotrichaceae bacterium]|nr:hypothetical protein [Erysipelotrichaceae bacterium]
MKMQDKSLWIDNIETLTFPKLEKDIKTPRCSPLGCALHYNEIDKTWEYPCHGSRYDKDGKLIDSPAKKDIEIEK